MAEKETHMGSQNVKGRVIEYLGRHPDQTVWRGQIAKDLGFTEPQVAAAIGSTLRATRQGISTAGNHIEVVDMGRAWRWKSNGTPMRPINKRLFEEVTTTKAGSIIAQSEDGTLYKLTELE